MSTPTTLLRTFILGAALLPLGASSIASAEMFPEWVANSPLGASLLAGLQSIVVDAAGNSYVTGISGSSSNTDILTRSFDPSGTLRWSKLFDGTAHWHDQSSGLALGPNGELWVVGNTPGPQSFANVLLLKYDAANGALLKTIVYSSAPATSEYGASVAVDPFGDVYVGGGTVGDGADGLLLKFDAAGAVQWTKVWDGPALAPYSQDRVLQIAIDPFGDVVALVHGVMVSNHPDFVVLKLDPQNGNTIWQATWGVSGDDHPRDMALDAAGDIYVTGDGTAATEQYSTIKLNGANGALVWQAYDKNTIENHVAAIAVDAHGGVYVTGAGDPDGDFSNLNDNIYAVKRDAATGAFLWSFAYGLNCKNCYDVSTDVIADSTGRVYIAGLTSSAPYSNDQITFAIDAASGIEVNRGVVFGANIWIAGSGTLRFDGAENLFHGATMSNPNTGAKEASVVKYTSLAQPIHQLLVTPLLGGSLATFTIKNAMPAATQFMIFGASGTASLPVPAYGVTLGIANPLILLTGTADSTGTFATSIFVPTGIAGYTAWFQAVEFQSTTAVIMRTVL